MYFKIGNLEEGIKHLETVSYWYKDKYISTISIFEANTYVKLAQQFLQKQEEKVVYVPANKYPNYFKK